jgi:hypothetical protein
MCVPLLLFLAIILHTVVPQVVSRSGYKLDLNVRLEWNFQQFPAPSVAYGVAQLRQEKNIVFVLFDGENTWTSTDDTQKYENYVWRQEILDIQPDVSKRKNIRDTLLCGVKFISNDLYCCYANFFIFPGIFL